MDPEFTRALGIYAVVVAEVVGIMVAGIIGGLYLDQRLNTAPLLILLGTFSGLALVIFRLVKIGQKWNKD